MNFSDQVISIWYIVYDNDMSKVYEFNNFDKALASIESSLRGYFGSEAQNAEELYMDIVSKVHARQQADEKFIPISIKYKGDTLLILLYNFEITAVHAVHKTLSACFPQVDAATQQKIKGLFSSTASHV